MGPYTRVILIVLDSVGIGAMPDAARYGPDDAGSDTLGHVLAQMATRGPLTGAGPRAASPRDPLDARPGRGPLEPQPGPRVTRLPVLASLGLGRIRPLPGLREPDSLRGCWGRCALKSDGKDTTTGHWEMAGIILDPGFPVFPGGFPAELVEAFERRIGRRTLGNVAASGTEIIQRLGPEHLRTGFPILYTSADSVFQLAAHEQRIPLDQLYAMCETARALLDGPWRVGRVIARPFIGDADTGFTRTRNRHDYAVPPPPGMLLDRLAEAGVAVHAVGKIFDIFLGRGISSHVPMRSNADGLDQTLAALDQIPRGFIFTNLVDFDMLYGHRNDVEGYAGALEEVDRYLERILARMHPGDLLLLTADHGCDPTTASTDHSREYVPLLAYGERLEPRDLGTRETLADIGAAVAENFGVRLNAGTSFLSSLRRAARAG